MPQTMIFLPQGIKKRSDSISKIRLAPDAHATRSLLETYHPVIKKVVDLSFPDADTIEHVFRRVELLYHELSHFWQKNHNKLNLDILAHFQNFTNTRMAQEMTMEFAAHMATVARSGIPYWMITDWAVGLSETGDVRPSSPMAYIDDWLLRQLTLELKPLVESKSPDAWRQIQEYLNSPLPFLSRFQGYSVIQLLLDAGVTPQELSNAAGTYHLRMFGPLMPMSILQSDAARRDPKGTRLAWVRGLLGIAATIIFMISSPALKLNSHYLTSAA